MNLLALLPEIHRRPTGGNLFNHHLLRCLEEDMDVERRMVDEVPSNSDRAADLTLVDSLLLAPAAAIPRSITGPKVLLAHYLHLFEPRCKRSPEAQRERKSLPSLDAVITTSEYCREILLQEGFKSSQLLAVMPGLTPNYSRPSPPRPAAPARLLTVATLLEGKGLELLLAVLETLQELPWRWEIAGDPGLDPTFSRRFRRQVELSPVADRIHFHGPVSGERVMELYDHSHLFVLPSRFETCSMATMEAMARALPVVAFGVGGLPERLPKSTKHLLSPLGDELGLADTLRALLSNLEEASRLGKENHLASRCFPSWEESALGIRDFIRRQAGSGSS